MAGIPNSLAYDELIARNKGILSITIERGYIMDVSQIGKFKRVPLRVV